MLYKNEGRRYPCDKSYHGLTPSKKRKIKNMNNIVDTIRNTKSNANDNVATFEVKVEKVKFASVKSLAYSGALSLLGAMDFAFRKTAEAVKSVYDVVAKFAAKAADDVAAWAASMLADLERFAKWILQKMQELRAKLLAFIKSCMEKMKVAKSLVESWLATELAKAKAYLSALEAVKQTQAAKA